MKLDDLGTIDLSAGIPPEDMTDDQWQVYFSRMREKVIPSKERKMNCKAAPMTVNGKRLSEQCSYSGDTQWYYYCQSINSILHAIRHKHKDYCYHIYQIADLLRFEHDSLKTRWSKKNQCFEVWLENYYG